MNGTDEAEDVDPVEQNLRDTMEEEKTKFVLQFHFLLLLQVITLLPESPYKWKNQILFKQNNYLDRQPKPQNSIGNNYSEFNHANLFIAFCIFAYFRRWAPTSFPSFGTNCLFSCTGQQLFEFFAYMAPGSFFPAVTYGNFAPS